MLLELESNKLINTEKRQDNKLIFISRLGIALIIIN